MGPDIEADQIIMTKVISVKFLEEVSSRALTRTVMPINISNIVNDY